MGVVRRLGLVGAWLLVVVVVTTVTWQIVSAADDQVSERPTSLNVAAPVISSLTTSTVTGTTQPSVTSTTVGSGVTTTTSEQNAAPTTTATTSAGWQAQSVQTAGGTVVVRYRPDEVTYQAATPAKGFYVEIEKFGPPEVRVKFESEGSEIEVRAVWQNDQLDVDISESGHD